METMGLQATQAALQKELGIEVNNRKFNENCFQDCLKKIAPRIENGEKFTLSGLDLLKKQIDIISNKINDLQTPNASSLNQALSNLNTVTRSNTVNNNNAISLEVEDLKRSLDYIKSTIRQLKSANDKTSTKFGGLNFSSGLDAKAWCEINLEPHGYGWLFDYHIIMQQVWTNMSGEDLVKR